MTKRILIIIGFFVGIQGLHSQTLSCKIEGTLINQAAYRYAYLYFNDSKSTLLTEIKDNHFLFEIPQSDIFTTAQFFLGFDSLKTLQDLVKERRVGINGVRSVVVENLKIIINTDMPNAKIFGSDLNRDLDEMYQAIKSLDYKNFIAQHLESQVSLHLIDTLSKVNKVKLPFGESAQYDVEGFYNMLSDQIKASTYGKKVWNNISKK